MWIKLTITIVTLLLLFDEYFKVIDKVKKGNRRKIILTVLLILSILSLLNVITEVNEGINLTRKADTLITNTNSIILDLDENLKAVETTSKSIIGIDSVLKNVRDSVSSQVDILKEAVNKSKELVKLEELKFDQDEASITVENSDIQLISDRTDSTLFSIKYQVINKGKRKATHVKFNSIILLYNNLLDKFFIIAPKDNSFFSEDIPSNTKGGQTMNSKITKEILFNNYNMIIFIITCEYQDAISKKIKKYKSDLIVDQLQTKDIKFYFLNNMTLAERINKVLIKNNLQEYLIDPNDW